MKLNLYINMFSLNSQTVTKYFYSIYILIIGTNMSFLNPDFYSLFSHYILIILSHILSITCISCEMNNIDNPNSF